MVDMDSRFPAPDIQLSPEAQKLETLRAAQLETDPEIQQLRDGFHAREQHVMSA